MGDYRATATVQAAGGVLFDYLPQVGNLPAYFTRMTSAEPGDGEEAHTTARMPDGHRDEGHAWFRVDEQAHRIEWGSEGPTDYRGSSEVTDGAGCAEVQVRMHTARIPDGNAEIQHGLDDTLATIERLVEQQNAVG